MCGFSSIWAGRADLGSAETAEQKLKNATFEASFFYVFMGKKLFLKNLKNTLGSALKII